MKLDIAQLVAWNDQHKVPNDIRMLKISEEYGEATNAYLGYLGANPRKGVTNGVEAVWLELADTALSALVAIASLGGDPESELLNRIAFVMARLGIGCPPVQVDTQQPADTQPCDMTGCPNSANPRFFHPLCDEHIAKFRAWEDRDRSIGPEPTINSESIVAAPRRVECLGPDERGRKWRDANGWTCTFVGDSSWSATWNGYLMTCNEPVKPSIAPCTGPFTEVVE